MRAWLLALGLLGCTGGDLDLRFRPPWSPGSAGVLVLYDEAGAITPPTPLVVADAPVSLEEDEDQAAELLLLEYPEVQGDLLRCGVALGGPWPALPTPLKAWLGTIDTPLALREVSPPGLDLRYGRCGPQSACDQRPVVVSTLPLPGVHLTHGASLEDGRWVLAGIANLTPVQPLVWVDAVGQVERRLDLPPDGIASLVSDQRDGAYLLMLNGTLYQIGSSSTAVPLATLPANSRLADRPDGLVVVADPAGPTLALSAGGGATPLSDFPPRVLALGLAAPDRMALVLENGVSVFDPRSGRFQVEWNDGGFGPKSNLIWMGDTLGVIGPEGALLRSATGDWRRWEAPPSGVPVNGAASLANLGFVVGDYGSSLIWDGLDWCEYARVSDHVNWVGVANGQVWATSNSTAFDRGPLLLRYLP
ncbi:MAG: hypothetical protein IPG45_25025 [Deltaproteobacteria bacterium]|nr:hypothetical protein [Deltaproteobacteria bacterium]